MLDQADHAAAARATRRTIKAIPDDFEAMTRILPTEEGGRNSNGREWSIAASITASSRNALISEPKPPPHSLSAASGSVRPRHHERYHEA